jgi:hypothetical protein
MESTGIRGKIQISEDTADLLRDAGKDRWIKRRDETVVAKGKGEMQTYWLAVTKEEEGSEMDSSGHSTNSWQAATDSLSHAEMKQTKAEMDTKTNRLVEWNVEVLMRLLKQIEARRRIMRQKNPKCEADADESALNTDDHMVIDEVREIITLPPDNYSEAILRAEQDVTLAPAVGEELADFVSNIASLYNESNPFHNFEHASHVTMSVVKLLSRIVAPSDNDFDENGTSLHDHTYGITSDPLTQFSCVLSALIHDGMCEKLLPCFGLPLTTPGTCLHPPRNVTLIISSFDSGQPLIPSSRLLSQSTTKAYRTRSSLPRTPMWHDSTRADLRRNRTR